MHDVEPKAGVFPQDGLEAERIAGTRAVLREFSVNRLFTLRPERSRTEMKREWDIELCRESEVGVSIVERAIWATMSCIRSA